MTETTDSGESGAVPKDAKTPQEAMAALVSAIFHDVPDAASGVETTFGQRSESAGGGWYWAVAWRMGITSTSDGRPRSRIPLNRQKVVADALTAAQEFVASVTPSGGDARPSLPGGAGPDPAG